MQVTIWQTMEADRRLKFIAYLKKASELKDLPPQLMEDQERLKLLIIPILENGDGLIPEDEDSLMNLGQRWQMTNDQLAEKITKLWQRMTEPLSAEKAGKIVKRSAGTMRKYAGKEIIHADINRKGQWRFTREVLIDHLNR